MKGEKKMAVHFSYKRETSIVETTQGKVRGYEYGGIEIFKGIPYAKARRFHRPEPVEPWEGILDATSYGFVCPLLAMEKPNGELLVPHRYWVMDEDCQNLNVWTPGCDEQKRPVMVWLHGGGYEAGSAIEQVAYEGENMCREGQVVVVSINHRLNILGYFDLSDFGEEYENSGNAGTDDIIAALRWIHDNIGKFGGDPENVTVFGQSGGGAKVTTLLQSPDADGLFAKGINMSGVIGLLQDCVGSGKDLAEAVMGELGVKNAGELEEVPYNALAAAYKKVKPVLMAEGKNVGCMPHPNAHYAGDPARVGFRKESAGIPLMVGSVFGEFTSFAPSEYDRNRMTEEEQRKLLEEELGRETVEELLPVFRRAYPRRPVVDLLKLDYIFRLPEQTYTKLRSSLNKQTYVYLFNYDFTVDGGRTPWHCADIPYFFHNTDLVPVTQEEGVTEKLEKEIFDAVMAFARTGCPDHPLIPLWPASTPEEEYVMVFGKKTELLCNFDRELVPLAAEKMIPVMEKKMKKMMENIQH